MKIIDRPYFGKTCPYCQFPIKQDSEVTVCRECHMPHHKECWDENGGCTTFGHQGQDRGRAINNSLANDSVIDINYEDLYQDDKNERGSVYSSYQKVGVGPRIGAILIDIIVIILPIYLSFLIYNAIMPYDGMVDSNYYVYFYLLSIVPYAWAILYFLFRDGIYEGKSWGKRIFNIMVVRLEDDKPCTPGSSVARNVLIVIFSFLWVISFVEFILPLFHRKGHRLGDMLAKTQVIEVANYQGFGHKVSLFNNKRTPSLNEVKHILLFILIGFILFGGLRLFVDSLLPSYDYSLDYGTTTFTVGTGDSDETPDIILNGSSYWEDVNYIDWIKVSDNQQEVAKILVEDTTGRMKDIPVIPDSLPLYHIFFMENYYALRGIELPDPFTVKVYARKDNSPLQGKEVLKVRIHNYLSSYPGETDFDAVGQTKEIEIVFYLEGEKPDPVPDYTLIEQALYRFAGSDNIVFTHHDEAQEKSFDEYDHDKRNLIYRYEKRNGHTVFVETGPPHSEYQDFGYLEWINGEWRKIDD